MSQKMGVRVGLVTEPKLIRKYKESFGTYWFPDSVQLNTIIVQRYDKQVFNFDVLKLDSAV